MRSGAGQRGVQVTGEARCELRVSPVTRVLRSPVAMTSDDAPRSQSASSPSGVAAAAPVGSVRSPPGRSRGYHSTGRPVCLRWLGGTP